MSDNYGYISLHRKIMQNFLFKEKRSFSKFEAWLFLLMSANHNDSKFLLGNELIEVKKGSFVTSEVKLMDQFLWSKSKLRAFLNLLQSEKMIEKNTDKKKTTLTIVKYSDYQQIETTKKPQKDYEKTTKKPQKDTNNNDNNYNNDNNLNNTILSNSIIDKNHEKKIDLEKRTLEFKEIVKSYSDKYDIELLKSFFYYWSEPTQDNKFKMKYEIQKTWSIEGRLRTWKNNNYGNKIKNNEAGSKSRERMDAIFNLVNRYKDS